MMANLFLRIGLIIGIGLCTSAYAAEFKLSSPAFSENKTIPLLYSCNGGNISPELRWDNVPVNTQSLVLVMKSPDAVFVPIFYNWILYNIPPTTTKLEKGANKYNLPQGTQVGMNSFHDASYAPPCPPDSNIHHYVFTLYALDSTLDLADGAEIQDILNEIEIHKISESHYIGTFSH